ILAEDEYLAFDNDLGEFDPDDYLDSCIEEVDSSPPPLADPPPRTHARSTLYENYTRALSNSMEAGGMSRGSRSRMYRLHEHNRHQSFGNSLARCGVDSPHVPLVSPRGVTDRHNALCRARNAPDVLAVLSVSARTDGNETTRCHHCRARAWLSCRGDSWPFPGCAGYLRKPTRLFAHSIKGRMPRAEALKCV
ncbi:hypothetical protein BD311DRAFT_818568, partial [Dichomitus squalens]